MTRIIKEHTLSLPDPEGTNSSIYPQKEEKLVQLHIEGMVNTALSANSQTNLTWFLKPSTVVHILVMIFGISTWISIYGIFMQLPLLIYSLPEGWELAAFLGITVQIANVAPIIYSLVHKLSFKINESYCILGMLGMETFAMGLLALLYDKTSNIAGKEYSTALFTLTFFMSSVSCTSSILFMPYLRNFKEVYLISYYIGEGLSAVIPSVVALIQGINESPDCNNNTTNNAEFPNVSARFSSQYFFLFLTICLLLSSVAFLLLENLSYINQEKNLSHSSGDNSLNNESKNDNFQMQISVISTGSISENDTMKRDICIDTYKKTDIENISNVRSEQSDQLTLENLYLYGLLIIACLMAYGFLPGIQPYSCLSYGNETYHLSATLSQIANPGTLLLTFWFIPHSKKVINGLIIVISIATGYVTYLALVSPNPPLQASQIGKILVILSWTLIMGLISYIKLIITSVFRRKSEKKLFYVGVAIQVGSACGAVLAFALISYTNLFQEHNPCEG